MGSVIEFWKSSKVIVGRKPRPLLACSAGVAGESVSSTEECWLWLPLKWKELSPGLPNADVLLLLLKAAELDWERKGRCTGALVDSSRGASGNAVKAEDVLPNLCVRHVNNAIPYAARVSGRTLFRTHLLPGLGNSLGPLGTLMFSRSVLFLRLLRLGRRSNPAGLEAEAGSEGLRKVLLSESGAVRWYLRRATDSLAVRT